MDAKRLLIMTAHPMIYPSMRRPIIDAFLDRGAKWMRIDHIPWNENPLVLWELEAIKSGKIKYGKRKAHEWRHKGKIYHRDVFNHVWQKEGGTMKWIGIYCPLSDSFNLKAKEVK
jgi:hypothetical protein